MITIERYIDWEERMYTFLVQRKGMPFAPGKNDCAMFCADHILNIAGVDLARDWRGNYSTKEEFDKIIDDAGGLDALVTRRLGEPTTPLGARRGDIVLAPFQHNDSLGICLGSTVAFMTVKGIDTTFKRRLVTKAWRVG